MLSTEVQDCVNSAMSSLSQMERAAFVLRHFEGRSIEEISDVARAQDERDEAQHLPGGQENARRARAARDRGPGVFGLTGDLPPEGGSHTSGSHKK